MEEKWRTLGAEAEPVPKNSNDAINSDSMPACSAWHATCPENKRMPVATHGHSQC
jgi:hypothetical protein